MIYFFKLESFKKCLTRACYACRTDSWSFWNFEWICSFQQYIIGTRELHSFSFLSMSHSWVAETFLLGWVSTFVLLMILLVAWSLLCSLDCMLWGYGHLGCLLGKFLLNLLRHSLSFCFLLVPHFGEKISGNTSFLNNSLLLPPPSFLEGRGCFKQWPY